MSRRSPDSSRWSWDLPRESPPVPQRALAPEHDFRRTVIFTVVGAILPGLGLIAARRRVLGGVILGLFGATVLGLGIYAATDLQGFLSKAVDPTILRRLAVGLIVVAALWVGVIIASHLSLRARPTSSQRAVGGVLVGLLAFAVAAPMAVAANYSYITASSVGSVFKSQDDTKSATRPTFGAPRASKGQPAKDPWADKPRLNILLLGGDAGKGRTGTRTDTVILASVDTKTGDTTMFSLPRNTARMPFPAGSPLDDYYPNGFTNGNGGNAEFFLNAMYGNVPATVPGDILGQTDDLGADALKTSVGEALGLKVDYYMLINLQGFSQMVNALGGIRLNINTYIPIGGNTDLHIPPKSFLEPGPDQKLNGTETLWYARGRYGSTDYTRMDRQRCVVNAIIKQANPATMLSRYEDIAKAGTTIVYTDVPQEVLPLMVDLSLRVKDGNIRSIVFKTGVKGFVSANPDFDLVREQVKTALGETTEASAPSSGAPSPSPTSGAPATPGKSSTPKTGTSAKTSEDVDSSCQYNAKIAATARPYTG